MKLAYVEVAGFRGFKNATRLVFPAGFVVLTGRNGVGKSTVLDAIDFALTGTIGKYAVKDAKGGGLESHIWWVGEGAVEEHYVSVGFVASDGHEISITRSRERGLHSAIDVIGHELCSGESLAELVARDLDADHAHPRRDFGRLELGPTRASAFYCRESCNWRPDWT